MSDNQNEFLNRKRQKKIEEIKKNMKILEPIFNNQAVKEVFKGLENFKLEEFSKFFQSLSNKEFKSISTHKQSYKVPIKLENLKFNPLQYDIDNSNKPTIDNINKFVIKNMGITTIDLNKKMNIENENKKVNNNELINYDEFFELIRTNIKNMISNNSTINYKSMKHIIKLYTTFIHMYGKIFDQDDRILLGMVKDIFQNSEENFNLLCIYWLYSEYLLCSKKVEFLRYDTLLNEILVILNKEITHTDVNLYTKLISNIPRYNIQFIKYIVEFNKNYIIQHFEELKTKSENKVPIIEQLPYLNSMRKIYIDIVKYEKISENDRERNRENFMEYLLDNFLEMTRNDNYDFNKRAIEFIIVNIYTIGSFEENKIKEFALNGLKDLLLIKDIESEKAKNDNLIKQKFPLYLFVCNIDPEVLYSSKNYCLPNIYSEAANIVRETLNQYLSQLLAKINKFNAVQLVNQCDEKSEEIVLNVIEIIYNNKNNLNEEKLNDDKLNDDKLYRSISKYYLDLFPNLIQGVISFSTKIPLNDFFTDYNFVLKKIQNSLNDTSENNLNSKILNKLNNNDNNNDSIKIFFGDNSVNCKNKIIFYIIYYYLKIKEFFKDIINLFLNYYIKIILDLKNKDEELKKELFNFSQVCISNISVIDCLESFNEIFNFCKNLPDEEKQFIQNMIYDLIITILNGKINSKNSSIEFNSVTFDKLIEMMKKHDIKFLIENFIPKLDNKIKEELRAKDLILFGDI